MKGMPFQVTAKANTKLPLKNQGLTEMASHIPILSNAQILSYLLNSTCFRLFLRVCGFVICSAQDACFRLRTPHPSNPISDAFCTLKAPQGQWLDPY